MMRGICYEYCMRFVRRPFTLLRFVAVVTSLVGVLASCAKGGRTDAGTSQSTSTGGATLARAATRIEGGAAHASLHHEASVERDDMYVIDARTDTLGTFVHVHSKVDPLPALKFDSKPPRLSIEWNMRRSRADQVAGLREMLRLLRERHGGILQNAILQTTLSESSYPEYVERLMLMANRDSEWTHSRNSGERALHDYIVGALRSQMDLLLPELVQVVAVVGNRPVIKGVEKCSSLAPEGFSGELKRRSTLMNLPKGRLLPAGCLLAWFDLVSAN
jgi:hypothetical protein